MNKNGLILFAALLIGIPGTGFAKVSLQADFQGTVMITGPEGTVSMLGAGDAIPEISSESKIEVFDGRIQISTEEGDRAVGACSGNEALLSGGASAEISCNNKEKEGALKVLEGEVLLKDSAGNSIQLKKGAVQKLNFEAFQLQAKKAPATAAGEETGSPIDSGISPVDSRSIQSSPSN